MKKLLVSFFLLSIAISHAQEKLTLSLDEAIDYALENNRNVINAERDIEAAEKKKWETTASGLPQVSATVDYQNFLKQQVSLIPASAFGGPEGEFEEVTFGTTHNVTATATLNQLIFDGSYLVGLQSAKVYLQISKNSKEKTDLEIKNQVINAYGNVLLSEENIEILKSNQEVLKKNLYETQQLFDNGLAEEEEAEQLKITLSDIEISLKNSMRLKDLAYKMLNITLGAPLETELELTDELKSLSENNIDLQLYDSELVLENNIDYKIAENNEKSQELLLKLEKSKALPTLNAFINGGYQGYGNEFDFFKKEQPWFGSSIFGVSLNVPIFSSLARSARTQQAKIEFEKAKTQLTETEQQLWYQFETAKSEYIFAIEQFKTAEKNLELAERIENKNQIKYTEGVATSFELRQAQTQLYTAQQNYLQSMLTIITKKATLETILNY
ncbi:Outer membrane protein TolC [Pustulibacterium marinum]|uniref:Outer membrane protein TolC n=1 Tax=Pustulibacterium marinum TaxID=1224947 RepID=A0A1I7I6P1_9FLAO|nr:TolC family protein [Pustulibacterium marinum]SFU68436.1 Outer membrane protein TolC [Pustulibacterium marinum]